MLDYLKRLFGHRKYIPLPYSQVIDYYWDRKEDAKIIKKYKVDHHAISLTDLPYKPSWDEVIYIENESDERTNQVILENIDLIKECFAKHNYVFVYLPSLANEIASDEKIWKYREPFKSQAGSLKLPQLKSDYLLNFLTNRENKNLIRPCIIRYNYSIVNPRYVDGKLVEGWHNIYDTFAFDICEAKDTKDYFEFLSEQVSGKLGWWSGVCCMGKKEYENADDAFEDETTKRLLAEVRYKIELLRRHGVSDVILESLVKPEPKLSRIVITKDYRIFLPDYNNLEIKMEPLVKAVYLLFLKHPDGIFFKDLPNYRRELAALYEKIKGTREMSRNVFGVMKYSKSIVAVTDPLCNSINEKCTRIKEAFLLKFHEDMAKEYYITGQRGERKRIALSEKLIIFE